ncbi:sensor histidine kinase [Ekhidna sp.]
MNSSASYFIENSNQLATPVADRDLAEIVNQNLTEAVFRCSSEGEILYVNQAFFQLFQVSDYSALLDKKAKSFYDDEKSVDVINDSLLGELGAYKGEVRFRKSNGTIFYGHLSARRVNKNSDYYVDGVIRDVTHERSTKLESEQQAEIQKILLSISSYFLEADLDSVDRIINQSLNDLGLFLGIDRLQVHHYDYKSEQCIVSHEWMLESISNASNINTSFPLQLLHEMILAHDKGQHIFYPSIPNLPNSPIKEVLMCQNVKSTLTIPMKLDSNCSGFIAFETIRNFSLEYSESVIAMLKLYANMVASISSRAASHVKLKKLIEQVTLQGKQHKDFSFITSHNIRASVANLVALTDLMNQDFSEKYLEMLDITVKKLNESINNINNILHLDHKELLKRTVCDVGKSVNRVLESLEMVIADQELIIENKVPASILLNTLPSYLDNILFQVISNAIKYGTNDRSKRITVRAERLSRKVILSIIDYGDGFDIVRHSHQIFKVGARFDQRKSDGQGLGLYITKQQVESLDGTIEIESSEISGTAVRISLPIF